MSANIEIPDLSPAGPINASTDLVLIRQGLSDRKATVAQIANIDFSIYTFLASPLKDTDALLVGVNDGLGAYQNYAINPQKLGFLSGTTMWFYQNTAPLGWQIVVGTGDRVLGTVGGSQAYSSAGLQGTWQQGDVSGIPNLGLDVKQIPNHQHWGRWGENQSDSQPKFLRGTRSFPSGGNPQYTETAILGVVNGAGDIPSHDAFGACDPHNHGSVWRPSAAVGIICQKII